MLAMPKMPNDFSKSTYRYSVPHPMRISARARPLRFLLAWICIGCLGVAVSGKLKADEHFYVSPNGDDLNSGSGERPLASIEAAQRLVRQRVVAGLSTDVIVHLDGGVYWLNQSLAFDERDSGTEEFSVTYQGDADELVIISGGRPLRDWRMTGGGTWTTSLVDNNLPREIRHLWVDGVRAERSRAPSRGEDPSYWQLAAATLTEDLTQYRLVLPAGLPRTLGQQELEIVVLGNWEINRFRVDRIDTNTGQVELRGPHAKGHDAIRPSVGRYCYLENVALLDRAGQWCVDRGEATLSYRPRDTDHIETSVAVVPVLEQLIHVAGTPEKPVRNLHFRGIEFQHAAARLPEGGYQGIQACHFVRGTDWTGVQGRVAAAVRWQHVAQSSLTQCRFRHLGGCGLELVAGCHDNLVEGNKFFDISGNAMMVGTQSNQPAPPSRNRLTNNYIHHCGVEYFGAVGIWVGFARQTLVAHNVIHELPYTGISVGWQWNSEPTSCRENCIAFNHVYDVTGILCDGGCIYTLGLQPGTVIRGNRLHGARRSPHAQGAPNNGLFIDEGSKGYLFEQNLIYDTSGDAVRFNQSQRDWHTWRANLYDPSQQPTSESDTAGLQPEFRHLLDNRQKNP